MGHGVYAVFVEVHRVGLAARLGLGFPETAARHESFALMAVALQEVGVDLVGKSLDEGPEVAVAGHVLSQFARGGGGVGGSRGRFHALPTLRPLSACKCMKKLCAFHLGPIKNQPADSVKADVLLSIQDRTAPAHTQATGGTRRQKGHRLLSRSVELLF